ncbi:hypothetical protein [Deminuibacter soli]|uniref:Uncharacterized protein n=1 Tax=Deminuibacter soli TaxID=2291815 RepID=A0A3E1NQ59_9BACT|nr:hypothetical protein [Deminuibacter soli]RFM30037.1 hypothetical protein DXN05_03435 [Deminuibacter soli]
MQVTINDKLHDVPFDLADISLGQYLEYHQQYGRELDEAMQVIAKKEYDGDQDDTDLLRQMDIDAHIDNEALAWFSFWTKHDLFDVRQAPLIQPLLDRYRLFRSILQQAFTEAQQLPASVLWNGDEWTIQDFKINPASSMSFNEVITAKEVMRQLHTLGKGRWEAMPYLCAVYFRKKDEAFTDDMVIEGGERLTLMQQLPMPYVCQVAFFLTICVHTWMTTLAYSQEEVQEMPNLN